MRNACGVIALRAIVWRSVSGERAVDKRQGDVSEPLNSVRSQDAAAAESRMALPIELVTFQLFEVLRPERARAAGFDLICEHQVVLHPLGGWHSRLIFEHAHWRLDFTRHGERIGVVGGRLSPGLQCQRSQHG